ncbi:hypothetical protein [Rheinheimera sp. 1928-s]|uniref:hypothetical protein n=1 Tax=Rheinheimera sp. 1928-s TaxID=3033803 RepID=UPI0026101E13|nr:hypothetical protein [Rheinheimera sp. 1928-s]MDF3125366.1 hypothetical protein [Rheinheimera sp. 1928-s]
MSALVGKSDLNKVSTEFLSAGLAGKSAFLFKQKHTKTLMGAWCSVPVSSGLIKSSGMQIFDLLIIVLNLHHIFSAKENTTP